MRWLERRKFSFTSTGKALVAVSGGVDSLALLHWLARSTKLQLIPVYIDHRQRTDTEKDWACVLKLSSKLQTCTPIRVSLAAHPGASEATLRDLRYEAFEKIAKIKRAKLLFTAHHADDELETFLLKIMRGSHPTSLRGIAAKSKRGSIEIRRPFLEFSKPELVEYAKRHNIKWHTDSTNQSKRYARNRVRNELIPLFENIRPKSTEKMLSFFKDLETSFPPRSLRPITKPLTQGIASQKLDFSELKAILDSLLGTDSKRTTRAHWQNVERILKQRQTTKTGGGPRKLVQFPGGGQLVFEGSLLRWESPLTKLQRKKV